MKAIKKLLQSLTYFDIGVILVLALLSIAFFSFFYRKAEYVNIRVKVTDKEVLYAWSQPQNWYAERFEIGDVEKDALGRVISEIVGIERFNVDSQRKAVYLDLKVRAVYDSRSKLYSARGKKLNFGTPIRFDFSKITFDGIVTEFPNSEYQKNLVIRDLKVVAKLRGISQNSAWTVEPEVVESIKKGDIIKDSNRVVLAEVLDSKVMPAEHITQTDRGELMLRYDPVFKDGIFTLRIRTKFYNGEPYVFDNVPLRIGEGLPLNFGHTSVFPVIVDIQN